MPPLLPEELCGHGSMQPRLSRHSSWRRGDGQATFSSRSAKKRQRGAIAMNEKKIRPDGLGSKSVNVNIGPRHVAGKEKVKLLCNQGNQDNHWQRGPGSHIFSYRINQGAFIWLILFLTNLALMQGSSFALRCPVNNEPMRALDVDNCTSRLCNNSWKTINCTGSLSKFRQDLKIRTLQKYGPVSDIALHKPAFDPSVNGYKADLLWDIQPQLRHFAYGYYVTISYAGSKDKLLKATDIQGKDCFVVPKSENSLRIKLTISTNCSKSDSLCFESFMMNNIYSSGHSYLKHLVKVEVTTIPWSLSVSKTFDFSRCSDMGCNPIPKRLANAQCRGGSSDGGHGNQLCDCDYAQIVYAEGNYSKETNNIMVTWAVPSVYSEKLNIEGFDIYITAHLNGDRTEELEPVERDASTRSIVVHRNYTSNLNNFSVTIHVWPVGRDVRKFPDIASIPVLHPTVAPTTRQRDSAPLVTNPTTTTTFPVTSPTTTTTTTAINPTWNSASYEVPIVSSVVVSFVAVFILVLLYRCRSAKKLRKNPAIYRLRDFPSDQKTGVTPPDPVVTTAPPPPPTSFDVSAYVSYARYPPHDSDDVCRLTGLLRCDGVEAILDKFYETKIAANRAGWISDNMEQAEFIIVVLTKYHSILMDENLTKLTSAEDFVLCHFETRIITACLLGSGQKIVPVYFGTLPLPFKLPLCLTSSKVYCVGSPPSPSSPGYRELLHRLHHVEQFSSPV